MMIIMDFWITVLMHTLWKETNYIRFIAVAEG